MLSPTPCPAVIIGDHDDDCANPDLHFCVCPQAGKLLDADPVVDELPAFTVTRLDFEQGRVVELTVSEHCDVADWELLLRSHVPQGSVFLGSLETRSLGSAARHEVAYLFWTS